MLSRTHLLALFSLAALPACNDVLGINPPADEVVDGSVATQRDTIEGAGDEDAGAD